MNRLLILATLIFAYNLHAQPIDKIIAHIGDNVVLLSDIENQKIQKKNEKEFTNQSDCSILEDLLLQNLLLNQAEIDSVKITDAQVDGEMENRIRIIENQIGGRQKMEEFYNKTVTQIKNEFRPLIKKRLMTEEMQRQITGSISVTPKEISLFFSNLPKDSIPLINEKLSFQQIVIFPKITQEDKNNTIQKLKDIREDIVEKGKSFESQARIHSQDPGSAAQGGKLSGTRGTMVPQFEATVFKLKEGEISNVFETDYGYHIIQLIERKGDDYTCRHILLVPEFNRQSLSEASNKMEECFQKLKQHKVTWEEAVVQYSNDNATKQNK
jgi:peptidyl-prolyl cis-trans isomerase SurA